MQDGGRNIDIDRRGEILRDESDGCFDLCRDFGGHYILLFLPPALFRLYGIPLLFFLLLL